LEALVGEVPEEARLARAPLPDEHQLRLLCDGLRPIEHRLVVRAHHFVHTSSQQRHLLILCLLRGRIVATCTASPAVETPKNKEQQHSE
jgi:hypothetical protein